MPFVKIKSLVGACGRGLEWAGVAALAVVAVLAHARDAGSVFLGNAVYFVDPDCYARMTRARMLFEDGFRSIGRHAFENFPDGIAPNTTAPMDAAIVGLAGLLGVFAEDPLPLAGALVSPVLGVVVLLLLAWQGIRVGRPLRWMTLLAFAFSPALAHAFALGRPDHQSLVLALCAAAVVCEAALWSGGGKATAALGGVFSGLALWTSLFEPLVFLGMAVALRAVFLRGGLPGGVWISWWLALGVVFLVGVVFDGLRIHGFSGEVAQFFPAWAAPIGEMARQWPWALFGECGWLLAPVPVLLLWRARRDRVFAAAAVALAILWALACLQARWTPFLALGFALCLPAAMAAFPSRILAWVLFVAGLWPVAATWEALLYPDHQRALAVYENRRESLLLRQAALHPSGARQKPDTDRVSILAPWWVCPAFVYWSGLPAVAGSSHYSMPGTLDTARFYLATDDSEARQILSKRKVRWVVAYDPQRIIRTSAPLLGTRPPGEPTMAARLWSRTAPKPPWLGPVFENTFFKIYEVSPP
jgi:hypothetical protein